MKRLIDLSHSEAQKIRDRQMKGTMSELYDDEKYLCFDEEEYESWQPRKVGRKTKWKGENENATNKESSN